MEKNIFLELDEWEPLVGIFKNAAVRPDGTTVELYRINIRQKEDKYFLYIREEPEWHGLVYGVLLDRKEFLDVLNGRTSLYNALHFKGTEIHFTRISRSGRTVCFIGTFDDIPKVSLPTENFRLGWSENVLQKP